MNDMIKTTVNKACGEEFDLFEKAFNESTTHHNFSRRHKRRMNAVFKYCGDPVTARKKFESKPFWSEFGAKQAAAAAAGFVVVSGMIFGGVKVVDTFSELADANKRYDELLKDGNYYLEGDSSVYFKVENGAITLCGDREKITEMFLNDQEVWEAQPDDPEFIEEWAKDETNYYMSGMKYALVETCGVSGSIKEDGEQITYQLPKYGL